MKTQRFPGKVSEPVVRSTALEVSIIAVLTIIFASPWPALLLVLDFGTRAFVTPKASPLAMISRTVWVPAFRLQGPMIFYTPKKFAARIGFVLSAAAALFLFLNLTAAGSILLAMLAVFAFLEGAFGYCVGCRIFAVLAGRGWLDASECRDCVN